MPSLFQKMLNKFLDYLPVFSACYLFFLVGVFANEVDITRPTVKAMKGVYSVSASFYNEYLRPDSYQAKSFYWMPARYEPKGVVNHKPGQFFGDYTLFTTADKQAARLIDQNGKLVHEWHYNYGDQNARGERAEYNDANNLMFWDQVKLLPNGDLIALVVMSGKTPWGVALIKLDQFSNLVWEKNATVHHDFDFDEVGNIYVLSQKLSAKQPSNRRFIAGPILEEFFSIYSPEGELLKEVSIYEAILNSPYHSILKRLKHSVTGDYLHPNAIEYIGPDKSAYAAYLHGNSVLIDLRDIESVVQIDLKREVVSAVLTGPWYRQHDPDILANGNLLIFDNRSLGERSRILEYNPKRMEIVWEYSGSDQNPLYSKIRSQQQMLGNGNVLITESNTARLLEVNREGELIWEYFYPVRTKDEGSSKVFNPVMMGGERFLAKQLDFLD